ncbi:MAG: hypothetical protein JWR74_2149 [Polaromonas sp.]|nr:hypothetical protein [Polaromonas sp.]
MPTCPYCQAPAQLVNGQAIYPHRPDLAGLRFWSCAPCRAYVGCHKAGAYTTIGGNKVISDGTLALGRLANAELRRAKQAAHAAFDPCWQGGGVPRRRAYAWLAEQMGLKVADMHIGELDVEQCERVVRVCRDHAGSDVYP